MFSKIERWRRIRRIACTASRGHGSNCELNLWLPRGLDHPGIPAFRSPSLRRSNCCRYFSVVSFSGTQAGKPGSFLVGVVTVMTRPKPVRHGKSRPLAGALAFIPERDSKCHDKMLGL